MLVVKSLLTDTFIIIISRCTKTPIGITLTNQSLRLFFELQPAAAVMSDLNQELADKLIDACTTGQLALLEVLLPEYHRAPAISVPTPQFLLQKAAKHGQADAVRLIFDSLPADDQRPHHPWEPNIPKSMGFNQIPDQWRIYEYGVILEALEGSDPLSVFKVFFEYGMQPDHNLDLATNTTACAVAMNKVDLVKFFLSHGANPTGHYLQAEDTYLGAAARRSSSEMLKLLLQHGSTLEGSQALRQAVERGQLRNAEILLDCGADVNEVYTRPDYLANKDEVMGCPLHFVNVDAWLDIPGERQVSRPEMVRFLLSRRAKLDVLDGQGRTPMQKAIQEKAEDVLQAFREHGGDK